MRKVKNRILMIKMNFVNFTGRQETIAYLNNSQRRLEIYKSYLCLNYL